MYAWVALVTIAALLAYIATVMQVGRGRGRLGIAAPAMTGHPEFERLVRIQINMLEWLPIFLPSLWLFAVYVGPRLAAAIGVVWIVGRLIYARAYARDPATRSLGFATQGLAAFALLLGALGGVVWALLGHPPF